MQGNPLILGCIVGRRSCLVLPSDTRSTHLHVCGATGTGKSKFLESLIRQDILNWRRSKSGLLLLDPHGALYDDLMRWLATVQLDVPVVPIDLRRKDWIVSYNLLRQRTINSSVVVSNFVDAMAYVWGQSGTDLTPLFARWATNTLQALYEKNYTLVEAMHLIDPNDRQLRSAMTRGLSDKLSERDWAAANQLSPKDFESQVSSTINRLGRFLRNKHLQAIFGQVDASLNLSQAIDEGHIVLVSLAKEKGVVSREDAEVFATLLLNDLWTAAQERGKSGKRKPFYVYVDEFQKFITPTISENLDEARGFGLHLTMAHQFPKQLINQGESGKRLFDSVMESARSKVVFQLSDEENLLPLAKWLFRGVMDPDEVKLKLFSTKVMDYRLEYEQVYSRVVTKGEGQNEAETNTEGETESGLGSSDDATAWSLHLSKGLSGGTSNSYSESQGDTSTPMLRPVLGKELSSVTFRSLDEQLFRAMAVLFDQKQRQGVARLAGVSTPVSFFTPTVNEAFARDERVEGFVQKQLAKWPFVLSYERAMDQLNSREARLRRELLEPKSDDEASTPRRILP